MDETLIIVIVSIVAVITFAYVTLKRKPTKSVYLFGEKERRILKQYVTFYNALEKERQNDFENRMQKFLSTTRITGINTEVERLDEVLIAASAIIPIFGFNNWEYINLNEVLLYPGPFDEMFNQEGDELTRAGLVGDGAYQNIMILSKHDLRQGFLNSESKHNTGIHEFVHLIDKTDGAIDGIPESLLDKQYVLPWLTLMQKNIQLIKEELSDINPYGATNQAEFFAVASEYFFNQPELLKESHPDLYDLLCKIFKHEK